ncbi:hypothetical protein BJY04DRAFT_184533 [Aspergillus karnatakaensis]|uniref:uncharacterized protein n=1 Tax=Aspergillus karnatakaensis TaxID=1810916 RepID=UPI003CCCA076
MRPKMPLPVVLTGKPTADFSTVLAPQNVAEICCRLFNLIRMLRAAVSREVFVVSKRRCTNADPALEGFLVAFRVPTRGLQSV